MRLIRAALSELTDLELAYFATFTAPKLPLQTQRKIWLYLSERNLNRTKAKALIELHERNQGEKDRGDCPGCKSSTGKAKGHSVEPREQWLTYADIQHPVNSKIASHWTDTTEQCTTCDTPKNTRTFPKPTVAGVRVFTNSLRS